MDFCLEMTNYQLSISLLQDFSVLKAFDCGIEAMNKFIRNDFQMSVENHFCEAYCVYSDKELIGLFALSFDSIDLDNDDKEDLQSGFSTFIPDIDYNYEDTFYSKRRYPALDIAYLAIQKNWRGKHIGTAIISEISNRAKNQRFAGCQFLTVEVYATNDYSAVDFYINCGFSPSELKNPNKDTLRMFMTLYSKE